MKVSGLTYSSPVRFTPAQRIQLALVPPLIAYPLKVLHRLNRYEIRNTDCRDETLAAHGHAVLAVFHEAIPLLVHAYRNLNYHSTASYSFDGELAARVIAYFGNEAVRGSSSRGGSQALQEMQKALQHPQVPCVALTIDGPRGPRRGCKPGVAILAARTQLPIVPSAAVATRKKRLRSWDRMPIPLPFGRVIVDFGRPISPPADDTPQAVERTRLQVELAVQQLQQALEGEIGDDPEC